MRPSSTTAAAVSSHDVSIPSMRVTRTSVARTPSSPARAARRRPATPRTRGVDLVRPHDERILAGVGVVALADADGNETEPAIHLLRGLVGESRLERERRRTARDPLAASASSNLVPMPWRCTDGSTAIVVTWPSLSDIIKPAYPTMSRPTFATTYARVDRRASSLTKSECDHGFGYTCCSMRSTDRRCRRRIDTMWTSSGSSAFRSATITRLVLPTRSRHRSCGGTRAARRPRR